MSHPEWQGWLGHNPDSVNGKMTWSQFEPKEWEETDIDIAVTHSSMCGSDLDALANNHGTTDYPICVGHELVGKITRIGTQVPSTLSIGDRVGIGGISDACLNRFGPCEPCTAGEPQYCPQLKATYASHHFNTSKAMGGHAKYHRCPASFVQKIPEGVRSEDAAPLLCGGITMYSPLKRYKCGPGKAVGIIGVGGLGHFGVVIAKALGADHVVGISRRGSKREEVLAMGADEYIATEDDKDWSTTHNNKFDLLISTVSAPDPRLSQYLWLLKRDGVFVQVGNPGEAGLSMSVWPIFMRRLTVTGSIIGSPSEMKELLQLAADKKMRFWVETRDMTEANQAILDMKAGKARYRYVLVNQ